MLDINPSKSILDQVDEYLHDNTDVIDNNTQNNTSDTFHHSTINTHAKASDGDIHLLENELEAKQTSEQEHQPNNNNNNQSSSSWISNNIQINLDQLSESLFREHYNTDKPLDNRSSNYNHQAHIFPENNNIMNGHHSLVTDMNGYSREHYANNNNNINNNNNNNTQAQTQASNNMVSHPNELNHMLNIPTELLFSPNASPLIAPNQASMGGIQVTPFMQPLTIKNDFNYGGNNINHQFLGDPLSALDTRTPYNNSRKISPGNSTSTFHLDNGLTLRDEDKNNIDNDPELIPLTRSKTSTSRNGSTHNNPNNNNNNGNGNNIGNSAKKSHSISGQSTSRSESSSKIIKNSPYLKANRSRRRFSKSRNSLENTPILSSSNAGNSNNSNSKSNNIPISGQNNNSDEASFQLPDSSVGSSGHTPSLSGSVGYTINASNNNDAMMSQHNNVLINQNNDVMMNQNNDVLIDQRNTGEVTNQEENSAIILEKNTRSRSRSGRVKDDSKKEIHKVAEQERRNRLNSALTELALLIPAELKETVSIPSKATTAELACVYIRQLQQALHERQ